MPHVYPRTIPIRFPRENYAPEVQPLPSTSSTSSWGLADTEGHADKNTEPHPEPHPELPGQVTPGEGESRPQADPSNPNQLAPQVHVPVPGMTVPAPRLIDLQADLHAPRSHCARTNYPERASTEKTRAMV